VSDHTGWLDRADSRGRVPTGRYVRLRMHLQTQKVPLGTWEDAHNHPIAAFVGYERLPGLGSIFVGLVGSASNYQHHLPGGQPSTANRTPSDARGLYDIIQQTRELDSDPEISRHWRDRADDFASDEERFDDAANLFNACKLYAPSRLLEALIEVHHRGVQRLHRGSCGLCG
jgi:hypothetical protein